MARGIFAGLIWGLIIGAVVLVMFAVLSEQRIISVMPPQVENVVAPGGSDFDQAKPEEDATLPETETAPDGQSAVQMQAPALDVPMSLTAEDRAALTTPETPTPDVSIETQGLEEVELGDAPSLEAPIDARTDVSAPSTPGDDSVPDTGALAVQPDPETGEAPAAQLAPPEAEQIESLTETMIMPAEQTAPDLPVGQVSDETGDQAVFSAPSQGDSPSVGVSAETAIAPIAETEQAARDVSTVPAEDDQPIVSVATDVLTEAANPDAPAAPSAETMPKAQAQAPSMPMTKLAEDEIIVDIEPPKAIRTPVAGLESAVAGVTVGRLVTMGGAEQVQQGSASIAAPASQELAVPSEDLPALQAFGTPFENAEGKPLFSVVLIDQPDQNVEISSLADFPMPLSIAIDPTEDGAADRARAYGAAGFEVLMQVTMPPGAKPQDLEVAYQSFQGNVPQSVAVISNGPNGLQSDRALTQQLISILAEDGQGLVTYDKGLNPALQVARRSGVAAASVFRVIDADGEAAPLMRRYLNRAAFRAAQEGYVIMIGSTRPETIAALTEWALEDRSASVAMAPVSAVLLLQ